LKLPHPRLGGSLADADVRLLKIFRAVVESGGFSAAEASLEMGISAISTAISDLEKRLDMKLCQRGRAGFSLTDQGQLVYNATLQLMASMENFRTEVNSIHAQLRGELNIGITDNLVTMFSHMRVTNSLAALKRRGPDVQINIRMMPPVDIERDVLDGKLHVGVIPAVKPLSGLQYMPLYSEQSQLYCGQLHPLFAVPEEQLTERLIKTQEYVMNTGKQPVGASAITQGMKLAATASDREGVAFLVLSGEYIGFLPTHYAQRWQSEGRMRALGTELFSFDTPYAATTRKGGRPNLVLETYLDELSREENDLPVIQT
jgi:LysR family transcriptional regulator, transcriptional activator for bauABCD operon